MKLSLYFFGFLAIVSAGLPAILMKQYNITKYINLIIFSILLFMFCIYTYYKIFTPDNNLSVIYPILKLLTLLSVAIIGIILFNEKINLDKIIGLGFAIVAVFFLSISDNN